MSSDPGRKIVKNIIFTEKTLEALDAMAQEERLPGEIEPNRSRVIRRLITDERERARR